MPNATSIALIPLLPLAGFLLLGIFGKYFRKTAGLIAALLLLASTALAMYIAYGYFFDYGRVGGLYQQLIPFKYVWLQIAENMSIDMGALLDPLSVMMLVVVTFISLMVHIYSTAYMKHEQRKTAYFSFLLLFTFSMLGLVLSSNILQIYIFWELVGVSSFLLIGFHYDRPSAVAACKKAFIVTRFADAGFLIGILVLSSLSHSFDFQVIIKTLSQPGFVAASFLGLSAFTWGLALVFMGGAGKSAMFPLHIWLPEAMEGPTPVSALIHAATMVVAGVFLVARLFPLFSIAPTAQSLVLYTGAFSALFAAVIACTQTDIKRVLAYSTMSQIGFMMLALGLNGIFSRDLLGNSGEGYTASLFHLFTHAFFKALLFLAAGAVIHFIHSNEMKDMGGLRKYLPITHITFLIACLAIAGIPPFAGFFSKEEILMAAFENNAPIYYLALFTSGLTAFYMFRLYFRIFWNRDVQREAHGEGGPAITIPLLVLAAGAAAAGFIPFGKYISSDGRPVETAVHLQFAIAPVALALVGIAAAGWLYKTPTGRPQKIRSALGALYRAAWRKFYIDELYVFITRKIIFNLVGRPAAWIDRNIVDGLVNATGNTTEKISEKIKGVQSGKVQQYAIYFLAGTLLLAVLFIYVWK